MSNKVEKDVAIACLRDLLGRLESDEIGVNGVSLGLDHETVRTDVFVPVILRFELKYFSNYLEKNS